MAQLYPSKLTDAIRRKRTLKAEVRVYDALQKQLDDNWVVFHGVPWLTLGRRDSVPRDGETDFILAHPDYGVLVLEVKGGGIRYDGEWRAWSSIDRDGREHSIDPISQAKNAKHALIDLIKSCPAWSDQWFVAGHAVCFPDCAMDHDLLPTDAPKSIIIDTNDLGDLARRLESILTYWRGDRQKSAPIDDVIAYMKQRLVVNFAEPPIVPPVVSPPKFYTAEVSRARPTAYLFLVDQSKSMANNGVYGQPKASWVADALNRTIEELVHRCSKSDGIRRYFDVGVLGYGRDECQDMLQYMGGSLLKPIGDFEDLCVRVEDRVMRMLNGVGGIIETTVRFPVWVEPSAVGNTPMCLALNTAAKAIAEWADAHPDSFPPTVIHITDGAASDGDPIEPATLIKQLSTDDGNCLLYNVMVSASSSTPITFPSSEMQLPTHENARQLYRMSSVLPDPMIAIANDLGHSVATGARGYIWNADVTALASLLDLGTRPANRMR